MGWLDVLTAGKSKTAGTPHAVTGRKAERGRRPRQRVAHYFDCTWSSPFGEERARISNISPTGCYIESRFSVPQTGTVLIDLSFTLFTAPLCVHGTVIDATPGVGFAVRFRDLDAHAVECLNMLAEAGAVQR
jgi:hypothetical protein